MTELCHGSSLALRSPVTRERSPELLLHLQELQAQLDNKKYASMVSDITTSEKRAEDAKDAAIMPSLKQQLGFGMHVLVTMFTFFAVAYYGSKMYLGASETMAGLGGVLGISFALVLETTLLIIRTNRLVPLEESMPELFDPAVYNKAYVKAAAAAKGSSTLKSATSANSVQIDPPVKSRSKQAKKRQ
ncbi:MAG: hypothetical protein WDW38_011068 [Sanguina aurantia]